MSGQLNWSRGLEDPIDRQKQPPQKFILELRLPLPSQWPEAMGLELDVPHMDQKMVGCEKQIFSAVNTL